MEHFDACLAATTMSAKYEFSRNMRKPVVSLQWLRDSAKAKKLAPMDRYRVLPLKGCLVSLTGYTTLQMRKKIEESVGRIGGIFMGDLVQTKTTHLIAASKDSSKYKHAKEWGNVKIVTDRWLDECERSGERLDEARFELVDAPPPVMKKQEKWVPPPPTEDDTPWDSHYLFGCRIYLVGFESPREECYSHTIMRQVRLGAAITTKDFRKATHILMSKFVTPWQMNEVKMAKEKCVKEGWLFMCTKEKACLPIEDYLVTDDAWERAKVIITRSDSGALSGNPTESSGGMGELDQVHQRTSRLKPTLPVQTLDVRSPPKVVPRAQNPLTREVLARTHVPNVPETFFHTGTELPPTEGFAVDKQGESGEAAAIFTPFVDVRIALSALLCEDEASVSREYISEGGGQVIDSRSGREFITAKYVVCPAAPDAKERNELARMKQVETTYVTCFWLEQCVKAGEILPATDSLAYQPLPCTVSNKTLAEVCVSTSSYDEMTKKSLKFLCVLLGAKYSDRLARTKNTHLVVPTADGAKYEAAKKWGLKVVTADWLYACVKSGSHVDESTFEPGTELAPKVDASEPVTQEKTRDSIDGSDEAPADDSTKTPGVQRKCLVMGKDLSGLLQTSPSPMGASGSKFSTPHRRATPNMDGKVTKSGSSRGRTPLSRSSSGITPKTKRQKSGIIKDNADCVADLVQDLADDVDVDNKDDHFPMPDQFPTPGRSKTKKQTNKPMVHLSSMQMSQLENNETQVGYADIKAANSPKQSARPDGADKLNTLFAVSRNAMHSSGPSRIQADEWA